MTTSDLYIIQSQVIIIIILIIINNISNKAAINVSGKFETILFPFWFAFSAADNRILRLKGLIRCWHRLLGKYALCQICRPTTTPPPTITIVAPRPLWYNYGKPGKWIRTGTTVRSHFRPTRNYYYNIIYLNSIHN